MGPPFSGNALTTPCLFVPKPGAKDIIEIMTRFKHRNSVGGKRK